jgi:pimeloyl-ACP methyl ester carboxylesterase
MGRVMDVDWQIREAGPLDAPHTVLLLPGGMCSAGSFAEVMAAPALAGTRLVAATLPGHAGAPPPDDYSIENNAHLAARLARKVGADVVVGFSMGASVALEMVASRDFNGPTVLLGVSLSAADEPAFFRAIVRLGDVLGGLPASLLAKGAASMVKRVRMPAGAGRTAGGFRKNVPQHMRRALREYMRWLRLHEHPQSGSAGPACRRGSSTPRRRDGGLTGDERRTLEAYDNATS